MSLYKMYYNLSIIVFEKKKKNNCTNDMRNI